MTALLETVPGIASVLRSPVADALVGLMRAAAGIAEFRVEDTQELIQYAVRRGLIGADEGDRLTADIQEAGQRRQKPPVKVASRPHHVVHKAPKAPSAKKAKAGKKRRA